MKLRGRVIRETALPKTHSGQVILSRHHYPRTPCGQALLYVIITRYYLQANPIVTSSLPDTTQRAQFNQAEIFSGF